jgi:hypothetical protein
MAEVSIHGSEYVKMWDYVLVIIHVLKRIALNVYVVGQPTGSDLWGNFHAAITCDTWYIK